jgi:hypothetical protein
MHGEIDPELHIQYLEKILVFDFPPKFLAYFFKKLSELYLELGKIEKARYYLSESLTLAPKISGVKKLKKKMALTTS